MFALFYLAALILCWLVASRYQGEPLGYVFILFGLTSLIFLIQSFVRGGGGRS